MALRLLIDAALVAGFGVQHSVLAMVRVKGPLARRGISAPLWRAGQSAINVAYIFAAAVAWQPVNIAVWHFSGVPALVVASIGVTGWVWYFQLHLFEYDVGLAFGATAILSRITGRNIPAPELWKVGSRRWIRFPVHTAFFPMFFGFPHMLLSTLVLAVTASIYNLIGTKLYDLRLEPLGKPYKDYQAVTGNILPRLRTPQGARSLVMRERTHWAHPTQYVAPLLLGLLAGGLYYELLGRGSYTIGGAAAAAGSATFVAVLSGVVLSTAGGRRRAAPDDSDYRDVQARVATAAATVSAVGLLTWTAITYSRTGNVPALGFVLPMWTIALWLGHSCLFLLGYSAERRPEAAAVGAFSRSRAEAQ